MSSTGRKTTIVASVIVGIITTLSIAIYKTVLNKDILKKIVRLRKLTSDGFKDFLEVQELNLRVKKKKPIHGGDHNKNSKKTIRVTWDSDSSEEYIVYLSKECITKMIVLNSENVLPFDPEDIDRLNNQQNWLRKITLQNKLYFDVPFIKFHCRVKSSRGRISHLLSYPVRRRPKKKKSDVVAWVTKMGKNNILSIQESNSETAAKVIEYKVVLYIEDGKGLIRTVPPFRGFTRVDLGELPPCLCYIKASRSIGISLEQFVTWIGEDQALTLLDEDFEE